jgi:hypothetical protein
MQITRVSGDLSFGTRPLCPREARYSTATISTVGLLHPSADNPTHPGCTPESTLELSRHKTDLDFTDYLVSAMNYFLFFFFFSFF